MIERIFHDYRKWEDFQQGMYESVCFMDSSRMVSDCESLLKCPEWPHEAMTFVALNWEYSSSQNLTNQHRNRQAWLGQAACCWVHGAPEYITKQAWNSLSEAEQSIANNVADGIISHWESQYKVGRLSWQN